MTDTTLTPNEPTPVEPKAISYLEQIGKEQEAGKAAAEGNAELQEKAMEERTKSTFDARVIASQREAVGNKRFADAAEKVRGMVEGAVPPPGPGLPMVDATVIAATMDPNNPVLNPDVSKLEATRSLPPGAHVPEPVLPQDAIETQFASKPPTEAHAKEGEEVAKGLPEPIYPPPTSQPQIALSEEEQKQLEDQRGAPAVPVEQRPVQ